MGAVLALSSTISPAHAAPQQILVEVVKPPVMVFDSPDQKKGTPLKPGKQTVAAGKWLKAGKSGKGFGVVRAYTLRGVKESKADGWLALTPLAASEATPYAAMLAEIMRPAGRLKGAPTLVTFWSPGQFGKVWVDTFRFRWAPTTVKTLRFKLMIPDSDVPLWTSAEVSADVGALETQDLVNALKSSLTAGVYSLNLEVQADGETFQQTLQIATETTQSELARELEWWSKNGAGISTFLGRASAFQKRGFLADAAQSYLAAWRTEPASALARDGFRGALARLGLDDAQIAAVMKQVSHPRKP